jgi:glycine cleavage system aminomethyltransferase T
MTQPTKLSPLHTTAESLGAQFTAVHNWRLPAQFTDPARETAVARHHVALCDQSANHKIQIQGEEAAAFLGADELAMGAGREAEGGFLYRLRADLFWRHGGTETEKPGFLEKLGFFGDAPITVTDITPGCAELWLVGPHSRRLLSRLCGLDFHERHFPDNTAKRSSVAKTTQTIIRRDQGELPAYALIGRRSLATYLWQTIMEAGKDLKIQPIGLDAFKQLA